MIEMRREKRWPIELQLEISSLFKQDNVKVENINAPIEVFDVSKAGIGFRTKSVLPIGYYFNARLVLGDQGAAELCSSYHSPAARWRRAYLRLRDCRNGIDYGLFV